MPSSVHPPLNARTTAQVQIDQCTNQGLRIRSERLQARQESTHPPLKASSMSARLKLAVRRLMPMPSVMVSKGLRSRLPSASSYVYMTPRFTWA